MADKTENPNLDKIVPISIRRLSELLKKEAELGALNLGGVDNWEWREASFEDAELTETCASIEALAASGELTPDF